MSTKIRKQLAPKANFINRNQDVLLVVDGSKYINPQDFQKQKQMCHAIVARISDKSQIGVVQFGTQTRVECSLTQKMEELYGKIDGMLQLGGDASLEPALIHCTTEFGLSRFPSNRKSVGIITGGTIDDSNNAVCAANKLKYKHNVTIFAIGGNENANTSTMHKVASINCFCLFEKAVARLKELLGFYLRNFEVQLTVEIEYQLDIPLKLGEEVQLVVEIDNVGRAPIPTSSRIIFKENEYFRETVSIIPGIACGDQTRITGKLVPKVKAAASTIDKLILALPEFIEIIVTDSESNEIPCDASGFFLNLEDFSGDIFQYNPLNGLAFSNFLIFGPPGAGKSSFINSVCSALNDIVIWLNVAATSEVVTSTLKRFPLYLVPEFENLRVALYDVPGIDGKNYKGDELALLMHGIMPPDTIDFKHLACTYNTVKNMRGTLLEEFERKIHVVVFFVPQGFSGDTEMMNRLAQQYYKITVEHKRQAIVLISHADEIATEEERNEVLHDVCRHLCIDSSNVFFLENYVDTKIKQFHIDKQLLRILMAMIKRADDFHTFERLHPIRSPFPENASTLNTSATDQYAKILQLQSQKSQLEFTNKKQQEKISLLESQLDLFRRKGVPPVQLSLNNYLKAVKRLSKARNRSENTIYPLQCLLSFAWESVNNEILLARLQKLKCELERAGMEVTLDIRVMKDDMRKFMVPEINRAHKLLLICTPTLKARIAEQNLNNLKMELDVALAKEKIMPNFIVPLLFSGYHHNSVPPELANIQAFDFSQQDYHEALASQTYGIIPALLGLSRNKEYKQICDRLFEELADFAKVSN